MPAPASSSADGAATLTAAGGGAAAAASGRGRTLFELTLLGAIWGGSFLFMRVAARDFGPLPLVEARLALGALTLMPFLWRARAQFAWGAERAPAGIGAITNAMTVVFTALVAFLFYGERIGARRVAGLIAGFIG